MRFCAVLLMLLVGVLPVVSQSLTSADVQTIIGQAVAKASSLNQKITVSVTDKEGNLLGTFQMSQAAANTTIMGRLGHGIEGLSVPSTAAAQSKAGTAAILSSGGNAFSTRTASFIIQEHFPPGIDNTPGGPLYGVQFSTLPCSDVAIAGLPLALSGDPGGIPLYKNGVAVGGVGVEGDGFYGVDRNPRDDDQPFEEVVAAAATRGFEAPALIRGDNILVGGIRFAYQNVNDTTGPPAVAAGTLPTLGAFTSPVRDAPVSDFVATSLGGVSGQMSKRFPIIAGSQLSVAEVTAILTNALTTANRTRAAIRQPIGSSARVNISVVDVDGKILGIVRTNDAPTFGFDVSVQKARSTNFFARNDAGTKLSTAGFNSYVQRASADGISLNGSIAFSDRGIGFVHRPLYPDGINETLAGPFSTPLSEWSPFNNGLQSDLVTAFFKAPMACRSASQMKQRMALALCPCTPLPELKNGLQIFAGGLPIYRGTTLVGAVGVSGDGIDQDDLIAAAGANAFAPPDNLRSDKFFVRGARLPFLKFPARPFLDE